MKKKVYYWAPFIDKVATVKSIINSASSLSKYSKKYEAIIINALGEWDEYEDILFRNNIKIHQLTENKFLKNIKGKGFIRSRAAYMYIIFKATVPLMLFIKKKKPEYLMIHLMTSIPLFINLFFRNKTKFILRISGLPKLNLIRKYLWKVNISYLFRIFSPTIDTKKNLEDLFSIKEKKITLLRDPIISNTEIIEKKRENQSEYKDYYLSVGRLTKQKNFIFLLKCITKLKHKNFKFLILGEGEQLYELKNFIKKNDLTNNVFLLGYKKNIYKYLKDAKALICTSLWEDPGFFLIESGYCNVPVISSDCPNGPKEILDHGNNGYLFKSNSEKDFINKFNEFNKDSSKILNTKILNLKKLTKEFTIFNHFKKLTSYLENEI